MHERSFSGTPSLAIVIGSYIVANYGGKVRLAASRIKKSGPMTTSGSRFFFVIAVYFLN
jgi:hypothetical protein